MNDNLRARALRAIKESTERWSKATPGLWVVQDEYDGESTHTLVIAANRPVATTRRLCGRNHHPEQIENAEAIAAAPAEATTLRGLLTEAMEALADAEKCNENANYRLFEFRQNGQDLASRIELEQVKRERDALRARLAREYACGYCAENPCPDCDTRTAERLQHLAEQDADLAHCMVEELKTRLLANRALGEADAEVVEQAHRHREVTSALLEQHAMVRNALAGRIERLREVLEELVERVQLARYGDNDDDIRLDATLKEALTLLKGA